MVAGGCRLHCRLLALLHLCRGNIFPSVSPVFADAPWLAWLQDVLVNSMSQWRSGFMTADGRWRQW